MPQADRPNSTARQLTDALIIEQSKKDERIRRLGQTLRKLAPLRDAIEEVDVDGPLFDALETYHRPLLDELASTQASTFYGCRVKAEAVEYLNPRDLKFSFLGDTLDMLLIRSILMDLMA